MESGLVLSGLALPGLLCLDRLCLDWFRWTGSAWIGSDIWPRDDKRVGRRGSDSGERGNWRYSRPVAGPGE